MLLSMWLKQVDMSPLEDGKNLMGANIPVSRVIDLCLPQMKI